VVRVGLGNSVDSVDSFCARSPSVQGSVMDIRVEVPELNYWDGKKDPEFV
jgi:hypothetical protein